MRKYLIVLGVFAALYIAWEETGYYWWRKINPGILYSNVTKPTFPSIYEHDYPMNTVKTDINRFYPGR